MLGKVTNNCNYNLEYHDEYDNNANFEDQNSLICGRFSGKYSDQSAKRVLNFFEREEYNPTVDKDTEMHDDLIVF